MTLAQYETSCEAMPGWQRAIAYNPAQVLRQQVARGVGFATARDAIAGQRQHHEGLSKTGQLTNFTTLSGP